MIAALILFGLRLAPLYRAIAQVESERGRVSANVYQMRRIYADDIVRLYPSMHFTRRDVYCRNKAEMMMFLYWSHYGNKYRKETGRKVTYEVLAKMHNRGGRYFVADPETQAMAEMYWQKVKKEIGR